MTLVYRNCDLEENLLNPPQALPFSQITMESNEGGGVCCQKLDQTKAASNIDWFRLSMKAADSGAWRVLDTQSVTFQGRLRIERTHICASSVCNEGMVVIVPRV